MNARHATFATCGTAAEPVTFRVGQPVAWDHAIERHERLTNSLIRSSYVRHERRKYPVRFYEVRAVDRHGRGLGRVDHAVAIPVPYRAHRVR